MLKLCFNTAILRRFDVFEALKHIKNAGYDAAELVLDEAHLHPLYSSERQIKEVRTFCEDLDLTIGCIAAGEPTLLASGVNYEPSMVCSDKAGRQKRLDVFKRSIDLAQIIGCPIVNFNSGIQREDTSDEEAHERFLTGMQELLAHAGQTVLSLEQEPGFFIGTTETTVKYIKALNDDRFRFTLDIGHVFCTEPEEDCFANIKTAIPYARHIHVEDIKNRVHYHEIPGEGDLDFKRILQLIKDAEYEHYVCVELFHHEQVWEKALKESRKYLLALQEEIEPE